MTVSKRKMLLSYHEGGRDETASSTLTKADEEQSSESSRGGQKIESSLPEYQQGRLSPTPYQLHLPSNSRWSLLLLSTIIPCLVSFLVGHGISYQYTNQRNQLHQQLMQQYYYNQQQEEQERQQNQTESSSLPLMTLPTPTIQHVHSKDKITDSVDILPESVYTSKHMFELSQSGFDYSSMFLGLDQKYQEQHDDDNAGIDKAVEHDKAVEQPAASTRRKQQRRRRRPQTHHYRANIPLVTTTTPLSKYQVAHTMIDLIHDCKLTMLSYHCYEHDNSSSSSGSITCVGILNERGHITVHSTSKKGLVMDLLYTSPAGSIVKTNTVGDEIRHYIQHHFGMYGGSSASIDPVDYTHRANFLSLRGQRKPNLVSHGQQTDKDIFVVASSSLGNATSSTTNAAAADGISSTIMQPGDDLLDATTTIVRREEIDVTTATISTTTLFYLILN